MVALVVRQMHFEQVQMVVDVPHQAQSLHHQMHRADTTTVHGRGSLRHFVVNVARPEHGTGLVLPGLGLEPPLDSLLAIPEDFAIGSIHSKWPFVGRCYLDNTRISTNIYRHFELFISIALKNHTC